MGLGAFGLRMGFFILIPLFVGVLGVKLVLLAFGDISFGIFLSESLLRKLPSYLKHYSLGTEENCDEEKRKIFVHF